MKLPFINTNLCYQDTLNIRQYVQLWSYKGDPLIDHVLIDDTEVVASFVVDEIAITMQPPLLLKRLQIPVVVINFSTESGEGLSQLIRHSDHDDIEFDP